VERELNSARTLSRNKRQREREREREREQGQYESRVPGNWTCVKVYVTGGGSGGGGGCGGGGQWGFGGWNSETCVLKPLEVGTLIELTEPEEETRVLIGYVYIRGCVSLAFLCGGGGGVAEGRRNLCALGYCLVDCVCVRL
jgi:hypothetical protein